ncbi:MAG: 6-bladed beta-propeller [Candidatus Delongbacteria bacterium]|jgi:hypothetical protein|nr:6-bladed beta-propeller [Candidatus Delongbacteria bacterium]
MKKIIILIATIVLLVSCTKNEKNYTVKEINGVKVYHNTTTPADPNFKITPKEVFTIQGYDESAKDTLRNFIFPHSVSLDSKKNIYVMDGKLSEVKKFDPKGNFLKNIGRKGTGPGEIQAAYDMAVINDTLYVVDSNTRLIPTSVSQRSNGALFYVEYFKRVQDFIFLS